MTLPPSEVRAAFEKIPDLPRHRLMRMRGLIFAAAEATGAAPLDECLKWGEPAYLPLKPRVGTTLRIGWKTATPSVCALYVNCNTDLVDRYRQHFPEDFTYRGAREVAVPVEGRFSEAAFQQLAAMALTYHRDKRR